MGGEISIDLCVVRITGGVRFYPVILFLTSGDASRGKFRDRVSGKQPSLCSFSSGYWPRPREEIFLLDLVTLPVSVLDHESRKANFSPIFSRQPREKLPRGCPLIPLHIPRSVNRLIAPLSSQTSRVFLRASGSARRRRVAAASPF